MKANSKEHFEMMAFFEKEHKSMRLDKEPKELWSKGNIYQNGETNAAFVSFRFGVSYGAAISR